MARGNGRQKLGGLTTKPVLQCPETKVRDTAPPRTGQSLSGKSSDGPTSFSIWNADFTDIHKCLYTNIHNF